MSFDSLLRHTCRLARMTHLADDSWGQPDKDYDFEIDIPCRLMQISGREIESRDHRGLVLSTHKLFMRPFDDVADDPREGDIIDGIVEADATIRDEHSDEFDIIRVNHVGEFGKEHHLEIYLVLRKGPLHA